ncbi:Alpha/Beta hydrolase protein [Flammula alnicola]|nr:Alpha/Beta hydrolase protein [Flammula alnicola]
MAVPVTQPVYAEQEVRTNRPRTKEIIDPSYPLLEANRRAIASIKRCTFKYGSTEEHQLDIYYPPVSQSRTTSEGEARHPILVFFYGGGLVHGARSSPPSNLVHNNLGAFFASRGILTVIPDYRLVPSITYPQGSEDVRDALEWTIRNIPEGNPSRIYILGHSAGGIHLSSLLLTPSFFSPLAHAVRGVVLMGTPCRLSPDMHKLYPVALTYYGSKQAISKEQPLGLLQRANEPYISSLPPVRVIIAGSERRATAASMRVFAEEFKRKGGSIEEFILEGHDHLSPILALMTGSGEDWGEDIVNWVKEGLDS